MVFGNYDSNKTHWTKLSVEPDNNLRMSFRESVCKHLGTTESEWKIYWNDMVAFRDEYVAHRDFAIRRPVPALEVAFFYDSWVRQLISPDIFDERPLRDVYAENSALLALEIASPRKSAGASLTYSAAAITSLLACILVWRFIKSPI